MNLLIAAWLLACTEPEPAKTPGNNTTIPTHGDAMVHSDGTRIVNADGAPLDLKCVNLDGWLQPIPYLISDSGNALFTSPTEFVGNLEGVVGPERATEFWRDYRDAFATESDFYVVLDLHSVPGGQNAVPTVSDVPQADPVARLWEGPDAAANQQATVTLWTSLAARYANHPALAGYDLLNEPALPASVDPAALPQLYARLIEAVRAEDGKHMVFVEGDDLAHDFSAFDAPLDDNMAYEFHAYALTGFEDWATPDPGDIAPYVALRAAHDRPLWLGEFGEGTIDWQTGVIDVVEGQDIGWAVYPWKRKQTWWFNPVVQQIDATPTWYALASHLAQPNGSPPSPQQAEAAMAEILAAVALDACTEDGAAANQLFDR